MEPIAPIAINVVLPSGEQVAQLMVNPEKSIMQMKTQIAGLEGTCLWSLFFLLVSTYFTIDSRLIYWIYWFKRVRGPLALLASETSAFQVPRWQTRFCS